MGNVKKGGRKVDERIYMIWLQQCLGYGNAEVKIVVENNRSIKSFYESGEFGWRLCGCFTNTQIKNMKKQENIEKAFKIFERCQKLGYDIITLADNRYPVLLREISNPPAVLYVEGDINCFKNEIPIAIIGSRDPTIHGKEICTDISGQMACEGAMIISGGAMGIDAAAHEGAISSGNKTIAVLGCGIDYKYLWVNKELRSKISKNGILVSEYPPGYPAYPYNFPRRNRIISGLSLAVIVVEAGEKSGSLITANFALEQNRNVLVAPVDMKNPLSKGIISLLNDGAQVVENPKDLIESYKLKFSRKKPKLTVRHNYDIEKENFNFKTQHLDSQNKSEKETFDFSLVSEYAEKVHSLFENETKIDVDYICRKLGMEVKKVSIALTELEIYGLIKNVNGVFYEKIRD